MKIFFEIVIIIGFLYYIRYLIVKSTEKKENNQNIENVKKNNYISNYITNGYVMTQTELIFYRELKKVTNKLELNIFPQVDLERIIKTKNNNFADRNRIKSRSVDFTIVNNSNCKIICCIELDDYTHNNYKAKKIDNFKNQIFKNVNIPLHRIKVNNYYNLEQLEQIIKEDIK